MAKHIHVHVHTSRTADAGFEESKHKRDAGGKFTAGGMNAEQHKAAAKEHRKSMEAGGSAARQHSSAAAHHEFAARSLASGDLETANSHAVKAQHYKAAASETDGREQPRWNRAQGDLLRKNAQGLSSSYERAQNKRKASGENKPSADETRLFRAFKEAEQKHIAYSRLVK